VPGRPYVLLSAAMSVDGCIDDSSADRLLLSDETDLDRVDEVRAGVDAILVGAGTVRRDDPRLLVRSADRRAARVAAGRAETPLKVTVTATGALDPTARFFTAGHAEKLADLHRRGVERLMVEGGTAVHTLFLTSGVVDEIQLAVAPFFVGDAGAPRFVGSGAFPHDAHHRMRLAEARPVGDLVLLRYLTGGTDG
jgi:5-amino-6-(5-phosphoribosylamino)uracil reductase